MTKNRAINDLVFLKQKLYNGIFQDRIGCIDYAIKALEELQMYRDGKLCLIPKDVYTRQCDELDAYKELGTVEEVREAVEKTNAKKCIQDSCSDHTHYKCPTCGKIQMSEYKRGIRILGRITNNCDNCGQRLEREE